MATPEAPDPIVYESLDQLSGLAIVEGLSIVDIPINDSKLALNGIELAIVPLVNPAEGAVLKVTPSIVHDTLWRLHIKSHAAASPSLAHMGIEVLQVNVWEEEPFVTLASRLYIPGRPKAAEMILKYVPKQLLAFKRTMPGVTRQTVSKKTVDNPYGVDTTVNKSNNRAVPAKKIGRTTTRYFTPTDWTIE